MDRREFLNTSIMATLAAKVLGDVTLGRAQAPAAPPAAAPAAARAGGRAAGVTAAQADPGPLHAPPPLDPRPGRTGRGGDRNHLRRRGTNHPGLSRPHRSDEGHHGTACLRQDDAEARPAGSNRSGAETRPTSSAPNLEPMVAAMGQLGVTHYWCGNDNYDLTKPILPQLDAIKKKVEALRGAEPEARHDAHVSHACRRQLGRLGRVGSALRPEGLRSQVRRAPLGHRAHVAPRQQHVGIAVADGRPVRGRHELEGPSLGAGARPARRGRRVPGSGGSSGGLGVASGGRGGAAGAERRVPRRAGAAGWRSPTGGCRRGQGGRAGAAGAGAPAARCAGGRRTGGGRRRRWRRVRRGRAGRARAWRPGGGPREFPLPLAGKTFARGGGWTSPYVPMGTGLVDIFRYGDRAARHRLQRPDGARSRVSARRRRRAAQTRSRCRACRCIGALKRDVLTIRAALQQSGSGIVI